MNDKLVMNIHLVYMFYEDCCITIGTELLEFRKLVISFRSVILIPYRYTMSFELEHNTMVRYYRKAFNLTVYETNLRATQESKQRNKFHFQFKTKFKK